MGKREEVAETASGILRWMPALELVVLVLVGEAEAASALNHPHLISIYDIGESAPKRNGVAQGPPVLYIAMELVAGETLRKALESRRLDAKRALEYLVQVVDALGAAHAALLVAPDHEERALRIAVGVRRGIAALQADLVRSLVAEVEEEVRVEAHPPVGIGIELDQPALDALGIELRVPGHVERVGQVDAAPIPADFDHLRPAIERLH